jgi:hypothetical protein
MQKHVYKIRIDQKNFDVTNQFITGAELKNLGGIPADYEVFLKVNGPGEDQLIRDADSVDLSQPGREHFYGCKPNTNNG